MGLWALTTAAVQGIVREHWGRKIPVGESGEKMDTGVNDFAIELMARLASKDPIQMPGPLELIQAPNAPAIRVFNNSGDGVVGDGTIILQVVNNTNVVNITNNGTIQITNNAGDVINVGGGGTGASGSLRVLTDVAVSVSSSGSVSVAGCSATLTVTNTVTITKTYSTVDFSNGSITGVS